MRSQLKGVPIPFMAGFGPAIRETFPRTVQPLADARPEAGHDKQTTSYPLWTLDKETVTRLAKEGGIVAPTGKPGSVLMFHGNLVHASPPNITPYPRKIVYLTLCAVSNHFTKFTRPEWIAHRDFTPLVPVADDALLQYARAHKVAAE